MLVVATDAVAVCFILFTLSAEECCIGAVGQKVKAAECIAIAKPFEAGSVLSRGLRAHPPIGWKWVILQPFLPSKIGLQNL